MQKKKQAGVRSFKAASAKDLTCISNAVQSRWLLALYKVTRGSSASEICTTWAFPKALQVHLRKRLKMAALATAKEVLRTVVMVAMLAMVAIGSLCARWSKEVPLRAGASRPAQGPIRSAVARLSIKQCFTSKKAELILQNKYNSIMVNHKKLSGLHNKSHMGPCSSLFLHAFGALLPAWPTLFLWYL